MHLYTFLQVLCLAVLWAVKSTQAALSFPFFLLLLIPVRLKLLTFIFTEQEFMQVMIIWPVCGTGGGGGGQQKVMRGQGGGGGGLRFQERPGNNSGITTQPLCVSWAWRIGVHFILCLKCVRVCVAGGGDTGKTGSPDVSSPDTNKLR